MTKLTFTNPYGAIIKHWTDKDGDKCFGEAGRIDNRNNGRYAVIHLKNVIYVDFGINLDDIPF